MQPVAKLSPTSDDEDDLESLRLAALQSLKRPPVVNNTAPVPVAPKTCNTTFGGPKGLNKRGRGFHGGGRAPRNGSFNNRIRNSNLISVQTIEPEGSTDVGRNKKFSDAAAVPKLILPQDRYCNKKQTEDKTSEITTKFDRYNDSDNSDSDSDSEDEKTLSESPKKLERANSLEMLMQELENEIQGDSKSAGEITSKPKSKIKKLRKPKEITDSEQPSVESPDDVCASESEVKTEATIEKPTCDETIQKSQNQLQDVKDNADSLPLKHEPKEVVFKKKCKSPVKPAILPKLRRLPVEKHVSQNLVTSNEPINLSYINPNVPVVTPLLPFQPMPYSNFNVSVGPTVPYDHPPLHYNFPSIPQIGHTNDINSPPRQMFSPNRYDRPISPLTIKTDVLNTIAAPLSPRSAAFVLQNREIIERRKKSPRRSYSRSPSPEFRRSLSPRYRRSNSRSPSPTRPRLSPTRRVSPIRRISPNLRRHSPCSQPSSRRSSPNRYRASPPKRSSPNGRISPKRPRRSPPRSNVRNRLGVQAQLRGKPDETTVNNEVDRKTRKRSRSISLSLSPSPERFSAKNSPLAQEIQENSMAADDPVLEARRRKFENSGTVQTEGIIRLKPKSSEEDEALLSNDSDDEKKVKPQTYTNEGEEVNEEELLGGDDTYIDFNVRVDDLFSDEESDNENEGRFKSGRQQTRGVTVMPFAQLMNDTSNNVKNETPLTEKRFYDRERDRRDRNRFERGDRSRSDRDRNLGKNTPERNKDREKARSRVCDRQRSRSPVRSQNRDAAIERKNKTDEMDKSTTSLSSTKSNESTKKEVGIPEKRSLKNLMSVKIDVKSDRKKPPIVSPIENKKIEIKIRNPSKYEVEKNKVDDTVKDKKANSRKVEVANDLVVNEPEEGEVEEPEPEVIIDNEEDEDEDLINKNEGDLRAQLSRKRAERQNKVPKVEGVPSRLLQNALQGAVFKKSKKSKSKKKEKETAPVDGKLPIHLRLGIPGNMDIFTDSKPHKKISRKRSKNRGNFEKV